MPYEHITYSNQDAPVARLTLNRPEVLNAYTSQMCRELLQALDAYQRDDSARVLVLTGAGRAFCSGGDVASPVEAEEADGRQFGQGMIMREGMHAVGLAMHRLDKPVIAMINGPAVAGGLTLALLCDIRVAGSSARLGDTSGRFGLLPDEGGAWLFPRAVGLDLALKMTWMHEVYDAAEALRLGLVTEVVPDAELESRVAELALGLAAQAPLAVRTVKRLMRRSQELTFEQSLGDAEITVNHVNASSDVAEGVAAFMEKRPPTFQGR